MYYVFLAFHIGTFHTGTFHISIHSKDRSIADSGCLLPMTTLEVDSVFGPKTKRRTKGNFFSLDKVYFQRPIDLLTQ